MGYRIVACLMVMSGVVAADTVTLKDGSKIDGIVTRPNQDVITVQVGTGKITFPTVDVASIESNEKKGDAGADPKAGPGALKKYEDPVEQRTGLTRAQRDAVRDKMEKLWSPDEAERALGRKQLVEMSKSMTVFQFIEQSMPYTKGLVVPEMLQTLHEIDPERAKPLVEQWVENVDPRNRARAIELMGKYKGDASVDTVVRGLVDVDPQVQVAAARALSNPGAKRATPVLIEGLKSANPRVQNAARDALSAIWGDTKAKSVEDWNKVWTAQGGKVKGALVHTALTPLVTAEQAASATPDHDE